MEEINPAGWGGFPWAGATVRPSRGTARTATRDFVRAVDDSTAIGGSLYDFATTSSSFWPYLRTLA